MNPVFLGVDPGITGAWKIVDTDGDIVDVLPQPTKADGRKSVVDVYQVIQFLSDFDIEFAGLERVAARPGQGVSSMFSFGRAYGAAESILQAKEIPFLRVAPQVWKGHFGFCTKDKDAPRVAALKRNWWLDVLEKKAKGQAIADAYYIGLFASLKQGEI